MANILNNSAQQSSRTTGLRHAAALFVEQNYCLVVWSVWWCRSHSDLMHDARPRVSTTGRLMIYQVAI